MTEMERELIQRLRQLDEDHGAEMGEILRKLFAAKLRMMATGELEPESAEGMVKDLLTVAGLA